MSFRGLPWPSRHVPFGIEGVAGAIQDLLLVDSREAALLRGRPPRWETVGCPAL